MCRKPHQESEPAGKALVQGEVTRQDTEHNTVRPVPQPSRVSGHILRPLLQHVVHEIQTGSSRDHGMKGSSCCSTAKAGIYSVVYSDR